MANHKSASKAYRASLKKSSQNTQRRSRIKTFITKLERCIVQKDIPIAQGAFRIAEAEIMRGVTKGVLKLNTASRKVSRLAKKIKALEVTQS